jgi:hypothetical protein
MLPRLPPAVDRGSGIAEHLSVGPTTALVTSAMSLGVRSRASWCGLDLSRSKRSAVASKLMSTSV